MRKLADLSLGNRALIALITVFVMGYGVIATGQLKQELIPSVSFPQAFIVATYPGASPQVMEQKVTVPIEQAVLSLQGLESSQSTSTSSTSTIIVTMKYGTNMSGVQQDLQAAISRIKSLLPEGVDTQVITGGFEAIPVLVTAATSDLDPSELSQRLSTLAVPKLEKLDGVRQVQVSGAPPQQVRVVVDPAKATTAGVTTTMVTQTIQSAGGLVSGGTVDEGENTLDVTIGKNFAAVDDIADLPILGAANPVTVGQVAEVSIGPGEVTTYSRTNGKASLTLLVTKTPEANTVSVSEEVNDALADIAAEIGGNTTFTTVFDQAPFITQSIEDLLTEGGLGLVMAIVVILLFLMSVRPTLVTAVSIPVSVLATMIALNVAGYSLNILTLGALTIAIGRVVDDSIVVIENIQRHLSYGEPREKAIKTAVGEVATAITSATITTVAVFLPIGLVSGQTGELFRPFAFTVAFALLSSLIVSLTIVPVLAYWFLRTPKVSGTRAEIEAAAHAKERRTWLQRIYMPALTWALRHSVISLLLAAAIMAGTVGLLFFGGVKTNFLGDSGQNTLTVTQSYPAGLSLDERDARAAKVEKAMLAVDGVDTVQTTVGSTGINFGQVGDADSATFNLTLNPDGDPPSIAEAVRKATDPLQDDGTIVVSAVQSGGSTAVEIIIQAPDTISLKKASDAVVAAMQNTPGATDLTTTLAANRPQVEVVVDPAKAAAYGLTDQAVAQALRAQLATATVGRMEYEGTSLDVVLTVADPPQGVDEMKALPIASPRGPVKLSDIATVTETTVATSISHYNGQISATVSLTPIEDNLGAVTNEVTSRLDGVQLPEGVTAEIGGVSAEQAEAFSQLGLALLVAILIVYVVMVATFKSLIQPLILAVSIPFAATGALLATIITDTPIGVPSLIGLLMLVGIVVTNAIVLIDLVNHYRAQGMGVDKALVEGARQRLRPILMTAVATVFALTPMALGLSGGGVFISRPLAIVVIGGLVSSTLLTLLLVPVLYHVIEGGRERRAARRAARAAALTPGAATDPKSDDAAEVTADTGEATESSESKPPRRAQQPTDPEPKDPEPKQTEPEEPKATKAKPKASGSKAPKSKPTGSKATGSKATGSKATKAKGATPQAD